jgi:predicted RND superfamily exporter protein
MEKYIDLVMRHPKKAVACIILITAILGSGLPKIEFESSLDSIMPKKDEQYILNEEVKKVHGNNGKFIIIAVTSEDLMTPENLAIVEKLHQDIEEYRNFDQYKEEERIEILKKALASGNITTQQLLSQYDHDPVFQRYLSRAFSGEDIEPGPLSSGDLKSILEKAEATLEVKKGRIIDLIVSPYEVEDLRGENNTLISYDLIERDDYYKRIIPETDEEIAAFRSKLENNPAFEKGIYYKNRETGKITDFGIMVRLRDSFVYDPIVKEMHQIAAGYQDEIKITLQGIPVIYQEINEYMKNDLKRFLPLVFLVVMFVFYLNFRSLRGVLIPFATLALADIWIVGLMGHLGFKLTVVGISLPPLMIAVGSSYSIHILNQYYNEFQGPEEGHHIKRIKSAMSHISLTVTLAGVTTFLGFFMLIVNQVSSVREMGVFSAIGVLFAVFISITMIPAVLTLLKHDEADRHIRVDEKKGPVDALIDIFSRWVINHSRLTLAILALIFIFSAAGLARIIVETSVFAYFKSDDYIITSSKVIGEKFGGSYGLNIIIDSHEDNGIKDPEILRFIEEFRVWLEADENSDLNIGRTDAITDFIKTMHLAMHDNDFSYYSIPDKKIDVESYISVYPGRDDSDSGLADDFEPYVDRNFRSTNILARIWEKEGELISSGIMNRINKKISAYLDENLPEGYTYKTAGEPKIIVRLSEYVISGQIMSLLFSLAAVALVVFLLFQNKTAALVSLIPISAAVLFNFGIMGWLGIRLDLATAIIASITIGIGIDDTIHFLNTYRYNKALGLNQNDAVEKTLKTAGRAIIYTSLALALGFLVLVISSFKPIIYFALLIAGTMISATAGALIFLPAAILAFNLDLSPAEGDSRFWRYFGLSRIFKFSNEEE